MSRVTTRPVRTRRRTASTNAEALEIIQKVLALEARSPRAFQDRSTSVGLEPFMVARAAEAPAGSSLRTQLEQVQAALAGYKTMDAAARRSAIERARALLAEGTISAAGAPSARRPAAAMQRGENIEPRDPGGRDSALGGRPHQRDRGGVMRGARESSSQKRTPRRAAAARGARSAERRRDRPSGRPSAAASETPPLALDAPVQVVPGVGPRRTKPLARLGIRSVGDLIRHFPRRHLDRRTFRKLADLAYGVEATVVGTVWQVTNTRTPVQRRPLTEAIIQDDTGFLRAIWFNQPYLKRTLSRPGRLILSGKPEPARGGGWQMVAPEIEFDSDDLLHTGRLVPVYPKTEGITDRSLRQWIRTALERTSGQLREYLPDSVRREAHLLPYEEAVAAYHFPPNPETHEAAVRRLAFDELFLLQLGMLRRKREWQGAVPGIPFPIRPDLVRHFAQHLPFDLTAAQQRAIEEILADMARPVPMSRLLQGDVGSGKTVVAGAALLAAVEAGYQGALMAPTEILAQQHHRTLQELLAPFGVQVELLIGTMKRAAKRAVWEATTAGEVGVLVGTHTLIQDEGEFHNLGLVIVDEQHRFGVRQRGALREKGHNPDMLVMTATPIPRTLALTVYGDLDLSLIDELPPGRQMIVTRWVPPAGRTGAYEFVRKQVRLGRQAFVICPLIEESEKVEARAARVEFQRLERQFPDLRLGLLHGKLRPRDKDHVMHDFRDGQLDVLVSTSVVEVGIDVPNATVMLIEGADRFGLAQLHQFRGRVGRGAHRSYCLLFSDTTDPGQNPRLKAIEDTHDGFALAEEDLRIRGPGEFFGTRQSGMPDLKVANLSDVRVLDLARRAADRIVQADPDLAQPEHQALREELEQFWQRGAASA